MAISVKAIYEHGFLKLLEPLDLDEGAEVEVLVFGEELGWDAQEAADRLNEIANADSNLIQDTPPDIAAILNDPTRTPAELLAAIASLAEPSNGVEDGSINHDKYLYGWEKSE